MLLTAGFRSSGDIGQTAETAFWVCTILSGIPPDWPSPDKPVVPPTSAMSACGVNISSSTLSVETRVSEIAAVTLDGKVSFKEASRAILLEATTSALIPTAADNSGAYTRRAADVAAATAAATASVATSCTCFSVGALIGSGTSGSDGAVFGWPVAFVRETTRFAVEPAPSPLNAFACATLLPTGFWTEFGLVLTPGCLVGADFSLRGVALGALPRGEA
mmetsp:Transcript_49517/g.78389  ORF Transcript_49517/g.78389 Transcript_49517/m.78389 type:complete len:219 (+) Transcript_49517:1565-2221(+)